MRLEIESLAYGGDAVARAPDGRTAFVRGACPGDIVDADVISEHSSYLKLCVTKIHVQSPARVTPPCPYFGVCPGCQWQHVNYETQLQAKFKTVVDALTRIGRLDNPPVATCIPSPNIYGYRNKIELNVEQTDRGIDVGMVAAAGKGIIPIDACLLLPDRASNLPKSIRGILRYLSSNRHNSLAMLRAGVRVATQCRDLEVSLWTQPGPFPRKIAAAMLSEATMATGITRVMIKGEISARKIAKVEVLAGRGAWQERIAGYSMLVSSPSFFQVNTLAADLLVRTAVEAAELSSSDRVLDLYSGVGTFTLPLAKLAAETVAVESYGPAVADLRRNIARAASPALIQPGDAAYVLKNLGNFDVVLVDPPRSGLIPAIAEQLPATGARRIVYVSCNPATLARDALRLREFGYVLTCATPVDLFPQTFHVETVAVFHRLKRQ